MLFWEYPSGWGAVWPVPGCFRIERTSRTNGYALSHLEGGNLRSVDRRRVDIGKTVPGFGALIASLPLVSVLGMMWLWTEKPDAKNMAAHAGATFWYVLPSLPMFLLIPALLRHGVGFWLALLLGCGLTVALYMAMTWLGPRFGLQL